MFKRLEIKNLFKKKTQYYPLRVYNYSALLIRKLSKNNQSNIPKEIIELIKNYILNIKELTQLICDCNLITYDNIVYNILKDKKFCKSQLRDIYAKSIIYPESTTCKYLQIKPYLSLNKIYNGKTFRQHKIAKIKQELKKIGCSNNLIEYMDHKKIIESYKISKSINQYIHGITLLHIASHLCDKESYINLKKRGAISTLVTQNKKKTVLDLVCMSKKISMYKMQILDIIEEYESKENKNKIKELSDKNKKNALIHLIENNCFISTLFDLISWFNFDIYKKYKDKSIIYNIITKYANSRNKDAIFRFLIYDPIHYLNYEIKQDLYDAVIKNEVFNPSVNNIQKSNNGGYSSIYITEFLDKEQSKRSSLQKNNYQNLKIYENNNLFLKGYCTKYNKNVSNNTTIINIIKEYLNDKLTLKAFLCTYNLEKIDRIAYNILNNINFNEKQIHDIFAVSSLYYKSLTYTFLKKKYNFSIGQKHYSGITFKNYRNTRIKKYLKDRYYSNKLIEFVEKKYLKNYKILKDINHYIYNKTLLHYASDECNKQIYSELKKHGATTTLVTKKNKYTVIDLACRSNKSPEEKIEFLKFLHSIEYRYNIKKIVNLSNQNKQNALFHLIDSESYNLELIFLLIKKYQHDIYKNVNKNSFIQTLLEKYLINQEYDIINNIIKTLFIEYNIKIKKEAYQFLKNDIFINSKNKKTRALLYKKLQDIEKNQKKYTIFK